MSQLRFAWLLSAGLALAIGCVHPREQTPFVPCEQTGTCALDGGEDGPSSDVDPVDGPAALDATRADTRAGHGPCTPRGLCATPEACRTGTLACTNGVATCVESGNEKEGTSCGTDKV